MRVWTIDRPFRWCFWRLAIDTGVAYRCSWGAGDRYTSWHRISFLPFVMWRDDLTAPRAGRVDDGKERP